ncbi:glucose 1-dehydrogenase [Nocardia sp. R7R-8]|uniref:glucose 1-dehydrogenase n=1 Tax=Nocardia sp. R7R-8 TaxID=3459304 RepID=UPI00403DC615
MSGKQFENKVVIVTGGASGQGKAAVLQFAAAGAAVVAADLDVDSAQRVVDEVRAAGGVASAVAADVSSEDDVRAMIAAAVDEFGRLDVLFNNAGIGFSARGRYTMASVVETPAADWDAVLAINLKGAALGCKHAIPVMLKQEQGGVIINNSSVNGIAGVTGADAYTAAKGGVVALTRTLAVEWGSRGIRVNCICPGAIETPMIAEALEDSEYAKAVRDDNPMKRLGKPEEIASVAVFLAGDAASYVNGAILPVDGGWTAK